MINKIKTIAKNNGFKINIQNDDILNMVKFQIFEHGKFTAISGFIYNNKLELEKNSCLVDDNSKKSDSSKLFDQLIELGG